MPSKRGRIELPRSGAVALVQFARPATDEFAAALRDLGVRLLAPTVEGSHYAWVTEAGLEALRRHPAFRGAAEVRPEDKLSEALAIGERPAYALTSDGRRRLRVQCFPGIGANEAVAAVAASGAEIASKDFAWRGALDAVADARQTLLLAALPQVYHVDYVPPPKVGTNANAAAISRIGVCQGAPSNLTGAGINVLVRDQGRVFPHTDLAGRLSYGADLAGVSDALAKSHSTGVAGTIGGAGIVNAAGKGMAPGCGIVSMDFLGDDVQELIDARASFGCRLSNHSYGFAIGWDGGLWLDDTSRFGQYSAFTRDWDSVVRSYDLVLVKAVGNDRADVGTGAHPPDGTFFGDAYYANLDDSCTGKNTIVVGAATDAADAGAPLATVVSDYSSAGPCDDGRIKPDLLANGDSLFTTDKGVDTYQSLTGTSSSTPVVSGAAALLQQRSVARGQALTATEMKALLINTAVDMGRPGPDALHGFGLLDAQAALATLDADAPADRRIVSQALSANGEARYYVLTSDGLPLSATACWMDPPGDVLAARSLVNDLDLKMTRIATGDVSYPFRLIPSDPSLPADTGVNAVDNVEQVRLGAPAAGDYLVEVRARTLSTPQTFALVSSHKLVEELAPVASFTASVSSGHLPLPVAFDGSASYDPDGAVTQYAWDFGDGFQALGPIANHTYTAEGIFTVRLTVTDDKGATGSATLSVTAINDAPAIVSVASPTKGLPPLTVQFDSTGTYDPDGAIVSLVWDFGDGATSTSAAPVHTFETVGLYDVRLTVTDNFGKASVSVIRIIVGQDLPVSRASFKLNFRTSAKDAFKVAATPLDFPGGIVLEGLVGQVRVADVPFTFILDKRGKYRSRELTIRATPARLKLAFKLGKADLRAALAACGAENATVKDKLVTVPVSVQFASEALFASDVTFIYNAKSGRSGSGKE